VISKQEIMGQSLYRLLSFFMNWFLGIMYPFLCHIYVYEPWCLCMMNWSNRYGKGYNLFLATVPELFCSDWGGPRKSEAKINIATVRLNGTATWQSVFWCSSAWLKNQRSLPACYLYVFQLLGIRFGDTNTLFLYYLFNDAICSSAYIV
jgi:hypothetical protein